MDDDSITELKRMGGFDGEATIFGLIVGEVTNSEDVGCEETVGPGMPVGGIAGIRRIVEDGYAHCLAVHGPAVIHPWGAFAPDLLFCFTAFRVDHLSASLVLRHGGGQTNSKSTFLGVAEGQLFERIDVV